MCNIDYIFHHWDPGTGRVKPVSAVEVTRTDGGVMLHAGPGAPGIKISEWGWADFVAAVRHGEFDATLGNQVTFRSSDVEPQATDVVEVTRTDSGVFLHVKPGTGMVHIPRMVWWNFIAGVYGKEFDDTLPDTEDDGASDVIGSSDDLGNGGPRGGPGYA